MRKHITWKELRKLTAQQFAHRLAGFLKRSAQNIYYRFSSPEFQRIVDQADGLCSVPVYRRIYEEIMKLPDLDLVEIGAAAGASTIACGLALRAGNKSSSIVVVEKCVGGSRERYGGLEDNLGRLKHNLERFGVAAQVKIFAEEITSENGTRVMELVKSPQIGALLCDADGRIDRDFALFWPRLVDGAAIIIDDYIPYYNKAKRDNYLRLGHDKQVLTSELLHYFEECGLFERRALVDNSIFGTKPAGAKWGKCDLTVCRGIVEDIHAQLLQIRKLAA